MENAAQARVGESGWEVFLGCGCCALSVVRRAHLRFLFCRLAVGLLVFDFCYTRAPLD